MIVTKHKPVPGGGFPAVRYNEDKIAEGLATLMAMENVSDELRCKVEALHCFGLDARAEIDCYLKDRSQTFGNSRTTRFQLHLSASVQGRAMSPEELTDFARELMNGIGYGRQPYFVYSHHDTGNNHVHIVTTRIQPNGKPIPDHQDYIILNDCANRILASDIGKDIDRIFSYDYETEGQFANIVRAHGYKLEKTEDGYRLFKGGANAGSIADSDILSHRTEKSRKRKERATQLKAIIKKYKDEIAQGKIPKPEQEKTKGRKKKPTSEKVNADIKKILDSEGKPLSAENQEKLQQLIDILKTRFGIDVFFQKDRNGQVRGYGLVDHAGKIALDGSKVMKLSELIDFATKQRKASPLDVYRDLFTAEIGREGLDDYVRIHTKDGNTYWTAISASQYLWYINAKPEEKEDVALKIASAMFRKQSLVMYLNRDPDFDPRTSIKNVTAYRNRNGGFSYSISFNDGYKTLGIPMDQDESDCYSKTDPDDKQDFLMRLAVDHITDKSAQDIVNRIEQQATSKIGVRSLPIRPKEYTPELVTAISHILSVNLSRFNVGIGHGQNREWEVGHKSRYDDLDNRMSDTRISM